MSARYDEENSFAQRSRSLKNLARIRIPGISMRIQAQQKQPKKSNKDFRDDHKTFQNICFC